MTASDRTKQTLAETLKEMTETIPMSRIRVVELCRRCGVDRRTFYYHFRDIYDLVAWIFDQNVQEAIAQHGGHPSRASILQVMQQARAEENFYRRALAEDSQNALARHILNVDLQLYERELKRLRGVETLSVADRFAINYHAYASVNVVRKWILSERAVSPEEFVNMMMQTMPPVLRNVLEPQNEQQKGEQGNE